MSKLEGIFYHHVIAIGGIVPAFYVEEEGLPSMMRSKSPIEAVRIASTAGVHRGWEDVMAREKPCEYPRKFQRQRLLESNVMLPERFQRPHPIR